MGLKEYEEVLKKMHEVCPSAFLDTMPWMNRGSTVIDDGLMRLRFVLGPNVRQNQPYMFTGKQFYALFTDVIFAALRAGCGAWIECFDIASLVPPEKEGEQKRRTESRKTNEQKDASKAWKRYPYNIEICDEGVRYADGRTEMLDIRGIMSYQVSRDKAIRYVIGCLENEPIPLGTQVIIDFDEDGPIQVIRREGTSRNAVFHLAGWSHLFGEADLQMPLWAWLFRKTDVEIRSGDTDTLCVLGCMIEQAARDSLDKEDPEREELIKAIRELLPNKIIWSRGALRGSTTTKARASVKAKAKRLFEAQAKGRRLEEKAPEPVRTHHHPIDLIELVCALLQMGVSMKVVTLILGHGMGSDFNKKDALAAQTGVTNVWVRLQDFKARLAKLKWHSSSLVRRQRKCVWDRVLGEPALADAGFIYSPGAEWKDGSDSDFDKACEVLMEFWEGVPRKRHEESSLETQKFGAMMCLWGTQYWMFPFSSIRVDPPSAFATADEWKESV